MNNTNAYESRIKFASRELNAIEKIKMKDLAATLSLDDELKNVEGNRILITPDLLLEIDIHNPKSKGGSDDYTVFVIVDGETGVRYRTSSESFKNAILDIWCELNEAGVALSEIKLLAFRKPSKNFAGKDFLTCTIA